MGQLPGSLHKKAFQGLMNKIIVHPTTVFLILNPVQLQEVFPHLFIIIRKASC